MREIKIDFPIYRRKPIPINAIIPKKIFVSLECIYKN
jgi:hypothetical protein